MAKSKRSSSQPSRQQRRLARRAQEVRVGRPSFGIRVAPEHRALAARVWAEVTGGDGVVLVDGKEVVPAP